MLLSFPAGAADRPNGGYSRQDSLKSVADSAAKKLLLTTGKETLAKGAAAKEAQLKGKVQAMQNKLAAGGDSLAAALKKDRLKKLVSVEPYAENSGLYQYDPQSRMYMNKTSVGTILNIGKLPVNAEYSHLFNTGRFSSSDDLFKLSFDRSSIPSSPFSSLSKFSSIKSLTGGMNIREYAGKLALSKLADAKSGGNAIATNALKSYLNNYQHIGDLLKLNPAQIKAKLIQVIEESPVHEEYEKIGSNQFSKSGLLQKANALKGSAEDGLANGKLNAAVLPSALQKSGSLKNTIQGVQKDIDKDGLSAAAMKLASQKADSVTKVITDVQTNLKKSGLDVVSLLKIEAALSKGDMPLDQIEALVPQETQYGKALYKAVHMFREIKTGSFGELVPGSMASKEVFMQGGHVALGGQFRNLTLGFAGMKDVGYLKDAGFDNSVYSAPRQLGYLSIRTNSSSWLNGKLTFLNSWSRRMGKEGTMSSSPKRSDAALTLTQSVHTPSYGNFSVELSKSAGTYNNMLTPGLENILETRNNLGYYLINDSYQTLSLGVSHQAELKKAGLSDKLYFSYSGSGYQNPASPSMNFSRLKAGGNLRKKVLGNKLSFGVRGDYQQTPLSPVNSNKWQNYQLQLDSRYYLSRKSSLSFKYSNMSSSMGTLGSPPVFGSRKLQVESNTSYRVGGLFSNTYLNLSSQQLNNSYQAELGSSRFILFNGAQTVVIGKNTLSANLLYNKELSAVKLIGDMLNSDASLQYTLFGHLVCSSGMTYLDNKGIARQAGIKQQVQLVSAGGFQVSAYADIRKNFYQPLYPGLYGTGRGEIQLRYQLQKKIRL